MQHFLELQCLDDDLLVFLQLSMPTNASLPLNILLMTRIEALDDKKDIL